MNPSTYRDRMREKIFSLHPEAMTGDIRAVMENLMPTFDNLSLKVGQDSIAESEWWLFYNPEDRAKLNDPKKRDSVLRRVRLAIHELRTEYGAPILSSDSGYWLCRDQSEADFYIGQLEHTVKSMSSSYYRTYHKMKGTLEATSSFFELMTN